MQAGNKTTTKKKIEPIHLVLVEEPEAHLHAQVQQVFVRNSYNLLRNSDDLRDNKDFHTQLIISTHSSHVAYEADFSCLRYFKRLAHNASRKKAPRSLVVNLSKLFEQPDDTQRFVAKYLKATHCDLFFSDAAIFIEGQAEKLLLPEFIKRNYPQLHKRYYSLVEVGGSHAHKFKKLIETLGIATLCITDLDSVDNNKRKAVAPTVGQDQLTANSILKKWHPQETRIDKLLSLKNQDHISQGYKGALYVAFQKKLKITGVTESFIPRTFEDALIFENSEALKNINGKGTSNKVKELVESEIKGDDLYSAIFSLVRSATKGEFALDCLMLERDEDISGLRPPQYIAMGLNWLEQYLDDQH